MKDCKDCKFKFEAPSKEPCIFCDNGSKFKKRVKKEDWKELRESVTQAIHNFPLTVDPCKVCKNKNRINGEQLETCKKCCYYYPSNFELE